MTAVPPAGELHPDDELSALVDGSLPPAEQAAVAQHVAGCEACQRQVDQLRAVRDVMRQLPLVDPPFGFFERTLRQGPHPRSTAHRRLWRGIFLTVVALVAVLGIVALVNHRQGQVSPEVAEVFDDFRTHVEPVAATRASGGEEPAGGLPGAVEGYAFVRMAEGAQGRYAVYTAGDSVVGVTWDEGELDVRGHPVPAGAEWHEGELAGRPALYVEADDVSVLVVARGSRVYTVVAEAPEGVLAQISADLPSPGSSPSVGQRVQSAGRALLESFGFGG